MRWSLVRPVFVLAVVSALASPALAEDGFEPIFDGKELGVWDGNPKFWRVEDGTITGETTEANPTKGNTFCIWRGGITEDFELKLEYKIVGGNSGVQYRSFEVPNERWVVGGYQADIDSGDTYSGINYGERFRNILANRGQETVLKRDGDKFAVDVVKTIGDSAEIQSKIKKEDWNSYHILVQGNRMEHRINGVTTSICTDDDAKERRFAGTLALQLHAGPAMKVQFRNIALKKLEPTAKRNFKKIVFLAGNPSHGFGNHDHQSGCMLLAWLLNQSGLPVQAEVHLHGWPQDASVLNDADTIISYTDGGARHPFNAHLEEVDALARKGVGTVFIHYGVEVPKGPSGEKFLDWTGGYFEPHWSVNPHWTAKYAKLPDHPITNGVKPFSTFDEWYYHMRFREQMDGVTPILTDLPTEETLKRDDGPHSGNPDVRKAIKNKEPQHMAWARERKDGGRGFGCTGGHVHWNWGHDQFRKLILNAIAWTAKVDVPSDGVLAGTVTVDDLLTNHDEPIPEDFNKARIQALLDEWKK
jgi:type 1 glutamine amidotransferase